MDAEQRQGNDGVEAHKGPDMTLGRMRERILTVLRPAVGWGKLKEAQHHKINNAVEQGCRETIKEDLPQIASRDFRFVMISVSGMKQTKEGMIEGKFTCAGTEENVLFVFRAGSCLMVNADPQDFMGAKPASVLKDQPDLMDAAQTSEQRETAEQERLLAGFQPTDDAGTLGGEAAKVLGDMLPPKIKAAADRGRALRFDGGAFKIPPDLEGKPAEVSAFQKAWEAADREAGAPTAETDETAEADGPAEPAKAPKGHRGKRTTTEQRVAKRQAETVDA